MGAVLRRALRAPSLLRTGGRAVVLSAVAVLALGACVAPKSQTTGDAEPTTPATTDAGGADLTEQVVAWEPCGDYECATVAAPLDWDDPTGETIQLAISRSVAQGSADARIGSLLVNPGGPGSSGIDFLDYAVTGVLGQDVLDAYDVVAFDPRGVGQSSAVSCGSDAYLDEVFLTDVEIESQADVDAERQRAREFGESCLQNTGPLLGEIDTVSAARDLELLRQVLGDEQLSYLGFSYGTFLGATYADLFPESVGRMVLDGALDPSITGDELVLGQAVGFEEALTAYVTDCQAGRDCPLTGSVEQGKQQIARVVEGAGRKPLDAGGGQVVNESMAFTGIVVTLYDDASWPYLTMALSEAIRENSGATLYQLANFYYDRTSEGQWETNSMEAFAAINCLDYPAAERSYDELAALAEEISEVAPTFGRDFAFDISCEVWPFESTAERGEIRAEGAAPIVVIGTTGDPATPYEWSVALADQLESGVLVTWEGEGHTAYGRAGDCVVDAVDAYLVEGTVPEEGLTC